MRPFIGIVEAARANPSHIVLSDGEDPRVIAGAIRSVRDGIARVTLVGNAATIGTALAALGASPGELAVEDPKTSTHGERYAERYFVSNKHKGIDEAASHKTIQEPLGFSAMMVRTGDADGTVGGATATTAKTVRTAIQTIGVAESSGLVSSFFLMGFCEPYHPKKGVFVFTDCGLVIDPDADELADIAVASAHSYQTLTGHTPRVAMLSFSTNGSASHERVVKVAQATEQIKSKYPQLLVEGEIQFDAAIVESVGLSKNPGSLLRGDANVFVFPNLDAGNIGYKIAQRLCNAQAIGPILQGLAKPANDLSRGCSAEDVYQMIAITSVQAAQRSLSEQRLEVN